MLRILLFSGSFLLPILLFSQPLPTPFERSAGKETATYAECIAFYRKLDQQSKKVSIRVTGMSDAGYPYHLILCSNDGTFDPALWRAKKKIIILVINGIHPGEPDGVDASMMLVRDLSAGKIRMPDNIALAVIPIYNIGGALNRNSFSRVNQNGPASYGFRGNAQDLDLNRDFTKSDSRDAMSFAAIFHWLNPDVELDNHVSDGADYQHTMTLISTQWNKLGGKTGDFMHDQFSPALYFGMERAGWPMCPYVNFDSGDPGKGWQAFMDEPRYSSGYAALFHVLSFISETHMLKPFRDRVWSDYALMQVLINTSSEKAAQIIRCRKEDFEADLRQHTFPLGWTCDSSHADTILFKGYQADQKTSEVTGLPRLYYDHARPFEKWIPYYNYFKGEQWVPAPDAYIIPRGWHEVVDLLKLNGVKMRRLERDSMLDVQVTRIEDYRSLPKAYEKHHKNVGVRVSTSVQAIQFFKGDYYISTNQDKRRFLIEMLEPAGDDSYFAWNFFDAILQQKEGYSDYRWEDVAAQYLKEHPDLKTLLDDKKRSDTAFATNARAQLAFIYRRSPYYEPDHMRYPVFSIPAGNLKDRKGK